MEKRGFTLIELLIVVAIIAILAGAMVPIFNITKQEARLARVMGDLDQIKIAAMMLRNDTGLWPSPGATASSYLLITSGGKSNWKGPYIDSWGADPWGAKYGLVITGAAAPKKLWASSEGASTASTDDIKVLISPSCGY